ncbi:MAG: hypothetical protein QM764_03610 [Chitinophagaceae bacterium]
MKKASFFKLVLLIFIFCLIRAFNSYSQPYILKSSSFKHYIDTFNSNDNELYKAYITNDKSWSFLVNNIPLFECPVRSIERTYYFRWWTYRKHIKQTPEGFVITEFLPDVPWAGKYNAISCAAGFHFSEGRWLHDTSYLDQYAKYWFSEGAEPRKYSFWAADAIYNYCIVSGDFTLVKKLLPSLVQNYHNWEKEKLDSTGLFWQVDGQDGMEVSICGEGSDGVGYRATINSYMYGDAIAIAKIARLSGNIDLADSFEQKAIVIKENLQGKLWSGDFFSVLPKTSFAILCSAKELHGYTPWYFNLPDSEYSKAWRYLMDPDYFFAPYGLTTAEKLAPKFAVSYKGHECQWNGPSWPYATSITMTALANLLNNYSQTYVSKSDYYKLLVTYTNSHQLKREDAKTVPWIDENLNPFTGDWIARTRLKTWENGTWSSEKGGIERGKDYNHSSYCDLIISGLIGVHPMEGNKLLLKPLITEDEWPYFCLDNVLYHGKILTIVYDKTGKKYKKGKGLLVFINGVLKASAATIKNMEIEL